MTDRSSKVHWEKLSPAEWVSAVGTVREVEGVWTAQVFRNQRTGEGWSESATGFPNAAGARRWVEHRAEE
jgi:hypothetical protein